MGERGENRRAEIWVFFFFFQSDNTRDKFLRQVLEVQDNNPVSSTVSSKYSMLFAQSRRRFCEHGLV